MKKTYMTPAARIKTMTEEASMMAASGLTDNGNNGFSQSDVTDGVEKDAGNALAKPLMNWDDEENQ